MKFLGIFSSLRIVFSALLLCSFFFPFQVVSSSSSGTSPDQYEKFYKKINYSFKDPRLFELVVTHHTKDLGSSVSLRGNERIEFLGDAILEWVMKEELWKRSSAAQARDIAKLTASLTENTILTAVANHIGLSTLTELPKKSLLHRKHPNREPLDDARADLVEALIGAIYLDSNSLDPLVNFVRCFWFSADAPTNFAASLFALSSEESQAQRELGYEFTNPAFHLISLKASLPLDILGQGIVKLSLSEFLYRRFPELPEGELANRRSLLLAKKNSPLLPHKLPSSDIYPLVGGLYLDSSLESARDFVLWHWTRPLVTEGLATDEVRGCLSKGINTPTSLTKVKYQPTVKEISPKTLLFEVLKVINHEPKFETQTLSNNPSTFQTSITIEPLSIITLPISASQLKEAERKAALEALDAITLSSLQGDVKAGSLPEGFQVKILEAYLKRYSPDFNYHLLATPPSKYAYRLEVQGQNLIPSNGEGLTIEQAKISAAERAINSFLAYKLEEFKADTPIVTLTEPLNFYHKLCKARLSRVGKIEIIPQAKSKEKITPLLTYEVSLPELKIVATGQGYSTRETELDGMLALLGKLSWPLLQLTYNIGGSDPNHPKSL